MRLAPLILLALALPARAQTTTPAARDSLALVALYRATNGPNWTRSDNWLRGRLRTWVGVTTNGTGRVEVLDLANNNLAGPLPSEIGALTALRRISLQTNALTGPIPRGVGGLAALETLTLFLNQLSGSIPAEIGKIAGLRSLGLGENQLSGAIPAALGDLDKLEQLDVNGNPLVGPLPDSFGRMASLRSLHIFNTRLSGPIPLTFVNLGALTDFRFTGTALCEPPDVAFQAWLGRVSHVESTGAACSTTAGDASPDAPVFALDPPAPNPSRGWASIRYGLAEPAHVSLVVADLLGRRVAVLVDGEQEAGRHVQSLDASAAGRLPSGTYVVQLRAGALVASRTLVVLR